MKARLVIVLRAGAIWAPDRRRRYLSVLAAATASVAVAAGCAVPTDQTAQAIDPSELPESLRPGFTVAPTTTTPAPLNETRPVYLLTQPQDIERTVVVAVDRQIPRNASLAELLSTLFGEITSAEEQAAGYFNPLELFEMLDTTVVDNVATVDIAPLSAEDADTLELVAAQLVFTASAWEGVDGVRILLNGAEVSVPTSDADAEPGAVLRPSAYEQFQADFAPSSTTSPALVSGDAA